MLNTEKEQLNHWIAYANERLKGKKVAAVQYMLSKDAEAMGWYSRPLIIIFTDGSHIFASSDDEGNNGGALFGADNEGDWTFPVLQTQ